MVTLPPTLQASCDPTREEKVCPTTGSATPVARGLSRVSPPPPSPPGPHGARKPLLMSSAKMMLVRRAGWDRRACTTALREHCCSSRPSGSILATSGRVDDLQQKDESALPGAAGEAGLRPEAAPDSQLRQLQPASDLGQAGQPSPSAGNRLRPPRAHPTGAGTLGNTPTFSSPDRIIPWNWK